jgi:predicted nucleic acid-binding protein
VVLADTSVWIEHWRKGEPGLARLLEGDDILVHPFVIGELSLGALHPRAQVIEDLRALPAVPLAEDSEVSVLVERHRLWGRRLGWIDVHLLASALIAGCRIWTRDRPLSAAAQRLGIGHSDR